MSMQQRFRTYTVGAFALVAVLIGAILVTALTEAALYRSEEIRCESLSRANELRTSSDDLTRLARTYVVTADAKYETEYWNILAARNGQRPRPDGRTVSLRKLMEELGFTEAEFAKLKEAEDNSNALVHTETVAMNAVKGRFEDGAGGFTKAGAPNLEMARRIMHDDKYHADKAIIMRPIDEFDRMLDERTKETVAAARGRSNAALWFIGILAAALGMMVYLTVRTVKNALTGVVAELQQGAEQVASAASQVSSSSQSLAQASSEQAASLEETSASSEEINSMARKNTENSRHAADLVTQSQEKFVETNESLDQMVVAMGEIKTSSDKISKIIKTIDEIAFQTNILALNAAVEAARAGEAGMGFAVVADEVRNLAQRCAQAAKETAALIEESVAKSNDGKNKVDQVAVAIRAITNESNQIKALVDEVNLGSQEQARGIEQIGRAVTQMEQVTQNTAANAEESASAAEELNAQSETLRDIVERLTAMVGGVMSNGHAQHTGSRATAVYGDQRQRRSEPSCDLSALRKAVSQPTNTGKHEMQTLSAKRFDKESVLVGEQLTEF